MPSFIIKLINKSIRQWEGKNTDKRHAMSRARVDSVSGHKTNSSIVSWLYWFLSKIKNWNEKTNQHNIYILTIIVRFDLFKIISFLLCLMFSFDDCVRASDSQPKAHHRGPREIDFNFSPHKPKLINFIWIFWNEIKIS